MTERRKLELQLNKPTEIELLYDEPVVGSSQYGEYFLYAVKSEGNEYAYFAPDDVHQELQSLRRGDKAVITKLAAQRGTKLVTKYVVDHCKEEGKGENPKDDNLQPLENNDNDSRQSDRLYDLMLTSYKDALQMQTDLNGMVDIEKIAITLFIARSNKR